MLRIMLEGFVDQLIYLFSIWFALCPSWELFDSWWRHAEYRAVVTSCQNFEPVDFGYHYIPRIQTKSVGNINWSGITYGERNKGNVQINNLLSEMFTTNPWRDWSTHCEFVKSPHKQFRLRTVSKNVLWEFQLGILTGIWEPWEHCVQGFLNPKDRHK